MDKAAAHGGRIGPQKGNKETTNIHSVFRRNIGGSRLEIVRKVYDLNQAPGTRKEAEDPPGGEGGAGAKDGL